jgi:hypothetical protein
VEQERKASGLRNDLLCVRLSFSVVLYSPYSSEVKDLVAVVALVIKSVSKSAVQLPHPLPSHSSLLLVCVERSHSS